MILIMKRIEIAISVALLLIAVKASASQTTEFQRLVERIQREGEADTFYRANDIVEALGIDSGAPAKGFEANLGETSDGMRHVCALILKNGKPLCVILTVKKKYKDHDNQPMFRLSLSGKLERAINDFGRYDVNGQPVPGSGITTVLALKSKETRATLQHELDFWLKGMYRKPAAQATAPESQRQPAATAATRQ